MDGRGGRIAPEVGRDGIYGLASSSVWRIAGLSPEGQPCCGCCNGGTVSLDVGSELALHTSLSWCCEKYQHLSVGQIQKFTTYIIETLLACKSSHTIIAIPSSIKNLPVLAWLLRDMLISDQFSDSNVEETE
jgi:hypothetical protein